MEKETIMKMVEQHPEKIKAFGVKKLTLIGSYAAGKQKKGSDIDFLVEFEEGRGLFDDYVHLLHFLEDLLGSKVDLGEPSLLREELKPYILEGKKGEARI